MSVPRTRIGTADAVAGELAVTGFAIEQLTVHPRKTDDDQDDLVVYCRKP